jgi:hypothetical protein
MTDYAEGAETPEEMQATLDAVAKMRRDNLEDAKRVILNAPPPSWMPCAADVREARNDA